MYNITADGAPDRGRRCREYCIGVDIGGTSIRIGLLDADGQLSAYEKIPQETVLCGDAAVRDAVTGNVETGGAAGQLAGLITDYIRKQSSDTVIAGVAIGIPGTLDAAREVVLSAPNVSGLDGVNLQAALSARLPFPVFIEKDVSMLFTYDRRRFRLPDTGVVMACYVGTGLGNAICIDGKLLNGSHGAAGELGHIPFAGGQAPCGCGNIGCAETVVGGKYLAGRKDDIFQATSMGDIFAVHADEPALQQYVAHLAAVIATEINILDPCVVVLGGGVPAMKGFPQGALEEAVRRHTRKPLPENQLTIIFADDNGTNGVIGAGLYAWRRLQRPIMEADSEKRAVLPAQTEKTAHLTYSAHPVHPVRSVQPVHPVRPVHPAFRTMPERGALLLCPSLMCADFAALGQELPLLEQAGADLFHIDIMDGAFVPSFGMGLQDTQYVMQNARIPVDVHLMVQNPGTHAEAFAKMGADIVYIHVEADVHAPRTLQKIIDAGAKAGIAVNPGTAAETIAPLLHMADYVLVMTVNPGFAGQAYLPFVDEKIDILLAWREKYGYRIVIDGACSPERIATLRRKGVDGFVLGTSALFGKGRGYGDIMDGLRQSVRE